MAEYIEREAVCDRCDNQKKYCDKSKCPVYKVPAADVVEVNHGRMDPKPLTLDELRRMVGEPVWAVRTDGGDMIREKKAAPCVLDYTVGFGAMRPTVIAIYGRNLSLGESDYGKTWLAYRQKPMEEVQG